MINFLCFHTKGSEDLDHNIVVYPKYNIQYPKKITLDLYYSLSNKAPHYALHLFVEELVPRNSITKNSLSLIFTSNKPFPLIVPRQKYGNQKPTIFQLVIFFRSVRNYLYITLPISLALCSLVFDQKPPNNSDSPRQRTFVRWVVGGGREQGTRACTLRWKYNYWRPKFLWQLENIFDNIFNQSGCWCWEHISPCLCQKIATRHYRMIFSHIWSLLVLSKSF